MPIIDTILEFREAVLKKRGPQIASKYKVTLVNNKGNSIICYPIGVTIPGRNFSFYEHDLWGPIRRVPHRRGYTQCNMTFMIYQDWSERSFLENWMNSIVVNSNVSNRISNTNSLNPPDDSTNNQIFQNFSFAGALGIGENAISEQSWSEILGVGNTKDATSKGKYTDYVNYKNGIGDVLIDCLASDNNYSINSSFRLEEAFPAQISPTTLASDGTGYPSFTVSFQYNKYLYY
jgi:hypothetical protein